MIHYIGLVVNANYESSNISTIRNNFAYRILVMIPYKNIDSYIIAILGNNR